MARRILVRALLVAFLVLLGTGRASADTIIFTFQGNASGSMGGTSFTNSTFDITLTTNTNNISEFTVPCGSPCTVYDVPATSATISVDGMSSAITSSIGVFDNQTMSILGLSRITGPGISGIGLDLMDLTDPAFNTYNLSTPLGTIGPFSFSDMSEFSCSSGCVITALGNVSMISATDITVSDPVATPEPATGLLLNSGVLLVAGFRRRLLARLRA